MHAIPCAAPPRATGRDWIDQWCCAILLSGSLVWLLFMTRGWFQIHCEHRTQPFSELHSGTLDVYPATKQDTIEQLLRQRGYLLTALNTGPPRRVVTCRRIRCP